MDLDELLSEPQIKNFLQDFPQQEWKLTLKKILLYGIASYKSLMSVGLAICKPVPGLKIKPDETKDHSHRTRDSHRGNTPNRSTSHSNFHKKCSGSHSCRHGSQYKSTAKSFKFDKVPPAKKLVGKEIAGKGRTVIGGLGFQSNIFTIEDSGIGSMLSVNRKPDEEVKKSATLEIVRAVDKVVPKLLRPVELKQIKNHNLSSISAQVFCSSSEISD